MSCLRYEVDALMGGRGDGKMSKKQQRKHDHNVVKAFTRELLNVAESDIKLADFIVRNNLADLVAGMNALAGGDLLGLDHIRSQIEARDREIANPYVKDTQVMNIHNARRYIGDRLVRTAKPHRILDPAHGPLIAVKLNILTRKTLGGFETDLDSRVFGRDGKIMPGLYAVGEAAGFGGGGVHGYRSLEGTFLGGCLFSGRNAGRAAAKATS